MTGSRVTSCFFSATPALFFFRTHCGLLRALESLCSFSSWPWHQHLKCSCAATSKWFGTGTTTCNSNSINCLSLVISFTFLGLGSIGLQLLVRRSSWWSWWVVPCIRRLESQELEIVEYELSFCYQIGWPWDPKSSVFLNWQHLDTIFLLRSSRHGFYPNK